MHQINTRPETCQQFHTLPPVLPALALNSTNTTHKLHEICTSAVLTLASVRRCFQWIHLIFHPPVRRSLDRTGRTPCRPQCNGRPLSVRYWEAAARGTNPNLLLRTESQHTSVDSNHSSAQRDPPAVCWWSHFRFICERGKWEEL